MRNFFSFRWIGSRWEPGPGASDVEANAQVTPDTTAVVRNEAGGSEEEEEDHNDNPSLEVLYPRDDRETTFE
jgi:hypothetical protein